MYVVYTVDINFEKLYTFTLEDEKYLDNVSYINYVSSTLIIEELDKIAKYISTRYNSKNQIPLLLSEQKENSINNNKICHICDRNLNKLPICLEKFKNEINIQIIYEKKLILRENVIEN